MGESLVETLKVENKMGDSVAHIPCLQESVSFGRFEHDSLCWERWSAFPTNKYLEEVEKCATPGSVAQKKAYFEAHYKKIAARKAELEEEKRREAESMNLEDPFTINSVSDTSEEDLDVEKSSTQNSADGRELLNEVCTSTSEVTDKHIDILSNSADIMIDENVVVNLNIEMTEHIDELTDDIEVLDEVNEDADLVVEVNKNIDVLDDKADEAIEKKDIQPECIDESVNDADNINLNKDAQLQPEDHNEDLQLNMLVPELPNEPILVAEETASARVWQDKEVLPQDKVDDRDIAERETKNQVESVDVVKMKKTTLVKKTTSTTLAKKKPTSPIPKRPAAPTSKSPMISSPKPLKPELIKTAKSTTRPAIKKDNGYTPLTSKKAARPENKRLTPTSLHMSLSYGPINSDPTRRKSLIMESMGEKDIVKRAFKAFQNVSVSPSSLMQPTATNQSATKRNEPKASAPDILQKKKEGIIRGAKATSASIGQHGIKKTSQSPGSKETIGVDQRNGKAVPISFGSRSLKQGSLQKEVSKKVEQNTNMKDARKTSFQSKLKAEKAPKIGNPSQRINSKPKLSSSRNQGHGFLRGSVRKEDAKV